MILEKDKIINKIMRGVAVCGLALSTACAPRVPDLVDNSEYTISLGYPYTLVLKGHGFLQSAKSTNTKNILYDLNKICDLEWIIYESFDQYVVGYNQNCDILPVRLLLKDRSFRDRPRFIKKTTDYTLTQVSANVVQSIGYLKHLLDFDSDGTSNAALGIEDVGKNCHIKHVSKAGASSFFITTQERDCLA